MVPEQPHPTAEELFAYRDGELTADRRVIIEAHVIACRACRDVIDEVSGLEADLRNRPNDARESYFDRLPDEVLKRVRAADTSPRYERRKSPEEAEWEVKRARRPRLPWAAILPVAGAAATVVVVVVLLTRQDAVWKSAPPVAVLERSAPDARGRYRDSTAAPPSRNESDRNKRVAATGGKDADSPRSNFAGEVGQGKEREEKADEKLAEVGSREVGGDQKISVRKSEVRRDQAPETTLALERQAVAQQKAGATAEDLRTLGSVAPAPSGAPGSESNQGAYAALLRRYGLPPLWGPGVSDELVLRAEPALRNLYRTGGAGSDSARVRIYLAEALRLRVGSAPDSVAIDEISHHYRRAIRLSDRDPETARIARERLEDFLEEIGAAP